MIDYYNEIKRYQIIFDCALEDLMNELVNVREKRQKELVQIKKIKWI